MSRQHIPVLLQETIEALNVQQDHWYIDGTFGRGGHTTEILNKGGKVIAFDVDQAAINYGNETFAKEIQEKRLILIRENFEKLKGVIEQLTSEEKIGEVAGVLFDFGTSVDQLKDPDRGFSFEGTAELDMRMDDRLGVKAKDILALIPEKQLTEMFAEYGGEREAKAVAKAIVAFRQKQPLQRVDQLASLVEKAKHEPRGHLHPATKVFQALRIIVNDELTSIKKVLPQALSVMKTGANLVAISFHEGEDRITKHTFRGWAEEGHGEVVTKDSITASEAELQSNSKARSARLRVFKKG